MNWYKIQVEDGLGYEVKVANYRGRIETCITTSETVLRNRKWTVWYERENTSGVIATGYCYGSATAEKLIQAVIAANP